MHVHSVDDGCSSLIASGSGKTTASEENQTVKSLTCAEVEVRNMTEQFTGKIGGRLKHFSYQWQCITSDHFMLNSVKHYKMEFENGDPKQLMPPREINFTQHEHEVIDKEIDKLIIKGVILQTTHYSHEYLCTIFISPKKDGDHRLILHLKNLKKHVGVSSFKLDTLQSIIRLMTPNC